MRKFIIFCLLLSVLIFPLISAQINQTNISTQKDLLNNPNNSIIFAEIPLTNQTAATGVVIGDDFVNIYYVIPIAMTVAMIIILIILIAIARLIDLNRRKHRIKPIIGLQSQPSSQIQT